MRRMAAIAGAWVVAASAWANEIGYVEAFALAPDRAEALKQLIPGTEDYYYYHCLHYQHAGELGKVRELLKPWVARYHDTPRVEEIRARQALLEYATDSDSSLRYIRRALDLRFDHQKIELEKEIRLPTALDPALIGSEKLAAEAFADRNDTGRFEDSAFDLLARSALTPDQRRHFLSRLSRPDYPGLPAMVVSDLAHPQSGGWGEHRVHGALLIDQLEECIKLKPDLLDHGNFVNTYLGKLLPGNDVDWVRDAAETDAYLKRLDAFVRRLSPAFNSLKAHVFYQRLIEQRRAGVYDRALFLDYLRLPRAVHYINPRYAAQPGLRDHRADLNADYRPHIPLPPVGGDEPLVRDFLMRFLKEDGKTDAFAETIAAEYLQGALAETMMVNGIGDMEKWYSLLSGEQVRALKERIDLELLPQNPRFIGAADPVSIEVAVKNVPKLIVKTFEINTANFYRQDQAEITTAIDLDGLVAGVEQTFTYDAVPLRRHVERFAFPHITRPGVYVIELIGNGVSSRALVRKGRLTFCQRVAAAGHVFTVYDEAGARVRDAALWIAGHEYRPEADADGEIAVPFSTSPGGQPVIVSRGDFAVLGRFDHQAESYQLNAGIYAEREALLDGETCRVVVRPELLVSGARADVSLLEDVVLSIRATDLDGIGSSQEVKDFKLFNDRASVHEFHVPRALAGLTFALRARVRNLSSGARDDLVVTHSTSVNGIDRTDKLESLLLRPCADGYAFELLGKTGEPHADRPVRFTLKHRDFTRPVTVTLKTDAAGRIALGALKDIVSVSAAGPEGTEEAWALEGDRCAHVPVVHGRVGEPVRVAFMGREPRDKALALSLLEVRGATFVRDWRDSASIRDGFVVMDDLPAGDYDLLIKPENRAVTVRLTGGPRDGGRIVSRDRVLEQGVTAPLQILSIDAGGGAVTVRLANATASTRVHVAATRFLRAAGPYERIGVPTSPPPGAEPVPRAESQYLSGRNIGDEYRYVLDRKYAARFPGNLLRRPSLLLNPWSLRKTETGTQTAEAGEAWAAEPTASPVVMRGMYGGRAAGARGGAAAGEFPNLDFLPSTSTVLENLEPDANGVVVAPRARLGGGQFVQVMAVGAASAVCRAVALPRAQEAYRDRRQTRILNPAQHVTEQKKARALPAGAALALADVRTSEVEIYDSLAKVHGLFATLSGDATLAEFAFVLRWPDLKPEEKRGLYSKYASHELNVFLFHKDRDFFAAVIRPYLASKKDQTFMDRWLLEADLSAYLRPWAYQRLNIAERALLARRIRDEAGRARRHVQDLYDLLPPDVDRFNHLFMTALKAGTLAGKGEGELGIDALRQSLEGADKAMLADGAVNGRLLSLARARPAGKSAQGLRRGGNREEADLELKAERAPGPPPSATAVPADMPAEKELAEGLAAGGRLARDFALRARVRRLYRALDKTEEWVENNYYRLPIEQQVAALVTVNGFWKDYAAYEGDGGFLSANVAEASRNFTEMMLALAVLDLPFKAGETKTQADGARVELRPSGAAVAFVKEITDAPAGEQSRALLVSQNFFARDDRFRVEDNEQVDKFVADEFQIARVYGGQVVLTNPTSSRRKVEVLLQIPEGAVPVLNGFYTRSLSRQIEPYSTQALEYYFYFPAAGDMRHYPVHVAQNEALVGYAEPFVFAVKEKPTRLDTESWPYVSQHAAPEAVLEYLRRNNIGRLDLNLIAFRMRDKAFFAPALALLDERHVYHDVLWSYGLYHNDPPAIREYLRHSPFAQRCGLYIDSPLLALDPVERHAWQIKEYWPLVNARVCPLGRTRRILNRQFYEQYAEFLRLMQYRPRLTDADKVAAVIYLLLQDRVEEALALSAGIDPAYAEARLQRDYLAAYLAFSRGEAAAAVKLARPYAEHPVERWRNLFGDVLAQAAEIEGDAARVVDGEDRAQQQTALADTAPALDFAIENREIALRYRNVEKCRVNFYLMDVELLFSRQPFVQDVGSQFSLVRPNETQEVDLPRRRDMVTVPLPAALRDRNVMIEISAGGVTRLQGYYPHALAVDTMENYGQLRVAQQKSGKPLPAVYVKAYARMKDGSVQFYKDGYTDLRGRFDYASLSTDELGNVDRFALLILSEESGAVIREAAPPKR